MLKKKQVKYCIIFIFKINVKIQIKYRLFLYKINVKIQVKIVCFLYKINVKIQEMFFFGFKNTSKILYVFLYKNKY